MYGKCKLPKWDDCKRHMAELDQYDVVRMTPALRWYDGAKVDRREG